MNKSKLKFFIGSILSLNCFFIIEKVDAAMRRPPSPPQSSQPSTSRSALSSGAATRPKYKSALKMQVSSLRRTQNLSEQEVKPIIDTAKKLVNEDNFSITNILERNLKFIGKNKADLKSTFDALDETNYKKSFDDYREAGKDIQYKETVYQFEKNDSNSGRQIYVKFALNNKELKNLRIRAFSDNAIEIDGVDSSQNVSKLLNDPEYIKIDFVGRIVDRAVSILKSKIESKNYHLSNRARYGLERLGYTQEDFTNIIKSLEKKDYISGPDIIKSDKDNKYHIKNGNVFIFGYVDPKTKKESYIKFIIEEGSNNILVLSFHESDTELKYFFKELR